MGLSTSTLMWAESYFEDGQRHEHDPNALTETWSCSEGHMWSVSRKPRCPALGCDWLGELRVSEARDTPPIRAGGSL